MLGHLQLGYRSKKSVGQNMMNTRAKQKLNITILIDGVITRMRRNRDKKIFESERLFSKFIFSCSENE